MTPIQQLEALANDVEVCGLDCEGDTIERRRYFSIVHRIRFALKELNTVTPPVVLQELCTPQGESK